VIIDQPSFVQHKQNLIDRDWLDHYHIHLHCYTTKDMHYTRPPEVDRAWPIIFGHLVFANKKACKGQWWSIVCTHRHRMDVSRQWWW